MIRCATHTVADADAAAARARDWLDYATIEAGAVPAALAQAWGAPASAGARYALCQPRSGAPVFLRFIEGAPVPGYRPIRSYGWAAIELCVEDVVAVNARMLDPASPYAVIGPPRRIAGLPTIHPMQVRGPDLETLYFTQITTDAPDSGLPRGAVGIDRVFIVVLACADLQATAAWFARTLGLDLTAPMAIPYTMIAKAFDLPASDLHAIVTASRDGDILLEFDQYPAGAVVRPAFPGALPPGVSICSLTHPDLDRLADWTSPPVVRQGAVYAGRRAGVMRTPEGAWLEVIEG